MLEVVVDVESEDKTLPKASFMSKALQVKELQATNATNKLKNIFLIFCMY